MGRRPTRSLSRTLSFFFPGMKATGLAVLLGLAASNPAQGRILYVDQSIAQPGNGLSWANTMGLYHFVGKDLKTIAELNKLSYARNNITGDPRYPTSRRIIFMPQPGSPLIDAGQDLPTLPRTDAMGNSRRLDGNLDGTATTDIGPIEVFNARVDVFGQPSPGQQVSVDVTGSSGLPVIMALGLKPGLGIYIGDLGYFFLDPSLPIAYFGWNPVGTPTKLGIPASTPLGSAAVLQCIGIGAKGANLSNVFDLRIR